MGVYECCQQLANMKCRDRLKNGYFATWQTASQQEKLPHNGAQAAKKIRRLPTPGTVIRSQTVGEPQNPAGLSTEQSCLISHENEKIRFRLSQTWHAGRP